MNTWLGMSVWLIVSLLAVLGVGVVACGIIAMFFLHILLKTLFSVNGRTADLKSVSLLTVITTVIFILEVVLMAELFCLLFK